MISRGKILGIMTVVVVAGCHLDCCCCCLGFLL